MCKEDFKHDTLTIIVCFREMHTCGNLIMFDSCSIFISQLLACNHHQIAYIMLYTVSHVVIDHDYCQVVEQIPIEEQIESARQEIYRLNREIELIRCERFGVSRFMYDDALIRFYTGFSSVRLFRSFIELLRPVKQNMKTWSQVQRARSKKVTNEIIINARNQSLSYEDQIFMCLCKFKLGLFDQDLAVRFNVSIATVSRIIITWTNFLYCTLGQLPIWPSKAQIKKTMPTSFKECYGSVRVVIDCTEIKVQTPSSLVLHSEFYSSYKSATTLKGLIGVTPSGAISFISSLYTGSISDKEITKRCGILDLLEEGDGVMADKGFTIEDILPNRCTLNIPPFLREKPHFTSSDVELTQRIAKLRIHVERAIRRVKQYHIFDAIIPLSMASSINQIWTVCCLLTDFSGPLFYRESDRLREKSRNCAGI